MVEHKKLIPEIVHRRSIRDYLEKSVEWEKIERILEAGRLAPTAKNRQEWQVIILNDKNKIKEMVSACANQSFVGKAPVLLVALSTENSYTMRCGIKAGYVDTSIVLENMVLQADHEGLGTCYIGAFYQEPVKKILNIPEDKQIVQILTLGYPAEPKMTIKRKNLNKCYSINKYEKKS